MKNKIEFDTDAYLVLGRENKRYISSFTGSSSMVVLLKNNKGLFLTDGRYELQAQEEVDEMFNIKVLENNSLFLDELKKFLIKNNIKTLGLDYNHIKLSNYNKYKKELNFLQLKEINNLVENKRICKTKEEIENIKQAAKITDKTLNHCLKFLKEGITEAQFANLLDYYHKEFGASGPSFDTIVAFGENSAYPHANISDKKLKNGDIIKIDFGCFYNGYCSDMTRTFFFGKPKDKKLIDIHNIVKRAHEEQLKHLKEGENTKEIDKIGRDIITKEGYGDTFNHGTGHGIGLEIHEAPRLNQLTDVDLKEGMVVTIEPGIYVQGLGGVRIEEDVVITKDGYEPINQTDKSYDLYNDFIKNN